MEEPQVASFRIQLVELAVAVARTMTRRVREEELAQASLELTRDLSQIHPVARARRAFDTQ
jgi:hypothetical protein